MIFSNELSITNYSMVWLCDVCIARELLLCYICRVRTRYFLTNGTPVLGSYDVDECYVCTNIKLILRVY